MAFLQPKSGDKEQALKHYQKVAHRYEEIVNSFFLRSLRERERKAVIDSMKAHANPGMRFLDVGCGAGFYSKKAKDLGLHVWAFDAVPEMVQSLEGSVDRAFVADTESINLDEKFDMILCAGVLEMVLDPAQVMKKFEGWLNLGGTLVILAPRKSLGGIYYLIEKQIFGFG